MVPSSVRLSWCYRYEPHQSWKVEVLLQEITSGGPFQCYRKITTSIFHLCENLDSILDRVK